MKYDLVFEGGGAKGMVFVGALKEFFGRGHTFDRAMGSSAGAIMSTFLAAGYTPPEMEAALSEKKDGEPVFASFLGSPGPFAEADVRNSTLADFVAELDIPGVPESIERRVEAWILNRLLSRQRFFHVFSFLEYGGWYSADDFLSWMREKLDTDGPDGQKRDFSADTLQAFFDKTGVELTLLGSDITGKQLLALNHRTAPDCPVVYAVRMSMSFPFAWPEVIWQKEWGTYRGRDITGHRVIDGGFLSNFPIELFLSGAEPVTAVMGPKKNTPVIGLLIDETQDVPNASAVIAAPPDDEKMSLKELRAVQRIFNLIDTVTQAHDKMVMDTFENRVVRLPAKGYGTMEFGMSDEKRAALINVGTARMSAYLDWRETVAFGDGPPDPREAKLADRIAGGILREP